MTEPIPIEIMKSMRVPQTIAAVSAYNSISHVPESPLFCRLRSGSSKKFPGHGQGLPENIATEKIKIQASNFTLFLLSQGMFLEALLCVEGFKFDHEWYGVQFCF